METTGTEEYNAFVRHFESRRRGHYNTWPMPDPDDPIIQASLGLYGPGPLLFFIFSGSPPVGVPLNQKLAFALALTVQIPTGVQAKQLKRLEREQGRRLTDEAVSELYDQACQESATDNLPPGLLCLHHSRGKARRGADHVLIPAILTHGIYIQRVSDASYREVIGDLC